MPITKVPIIHKFGIISQSQREQLQERLMKQAYNKPDVSSNRVTATRNPLDINDDFISQYNDASTYEEKKKVEDLAKKMLSRAKRRVGIKDGSHGNHVDLPRGWSELSILAQCQGHVQEEALDTLIISLDQAQLVRSHIPSLFFLAETTLYWLRTDAMNQPYLRSGEIKLLKMGHLVFTRLFYHHMSGHLHGHSEFKNRLVTYLEGFMECQEAYSPYPGAHLSLRYISEVGKMIIGHQQVDPGEVKEADKTADDKLVFDIDDDDDHKVASGIESSIHDLSPTLWHALDVWRCSVHLSTGLQEALHALALCGSGIASENWVDAASALQVITEAAKNNMSVLKTLQNLGRGIIPGQERDSDGMKRHSSQDFSLSVSNTLANEMDSILSNVSLDTSAQDVDLPELQELEQKKMSQESDLMVVRPEGEGYYSKSSRHASMTALVGTPQDRKEEALSSESIDGRITEQSSEPGSIADISTGDESLDSAGGIQATQHDGPISSGEDSDLAPGDHSETEARPDDVTQMKMMKTTPSTKREVTWDEKLTDDKHSSRGPSRGVNDTSRSSMRSTIKSPKSVTIDPVPNTAYYAEIGTSLPSAGRTSQATSMTSYTNIPVPDLTGLRGWRWEVVFMYTEMMTALCLHGKSAAIQKLSLLGTGRPNVLPTYKKDESSVMASAGLLDLAEFQTLTETGERGSGDWSWRIRYTAVQGLVKLCRCVQGDKCREGLRTVAWNALMRCHTRERDDRVLEAFKVGQVEAELEAKRLQSMSGSPVENLSAKLAAGLASIYLPPLPPPIESPKPNKARGKKTPSPAPGVPKLTQTRPSLREDIMLSMALYEPGVDYKTRTSLDLKRIVEDQWRKDLQKQQTDGEADKAKELDNKQKLEEERQKEIETKKKEKLTGKTKDR
ncbi:uncharacterized protein LOC144450269 [Glandiceps talaboti]